MFVATGQTQPSPERIPALLVVAVGGNSVSVGQSVLVAAFGGWPLIVAIPFGVVASLSTE